MKRIAVFCASSLGARPTYAEAAKALAHVLAQRRMEVVYGGGNIGLMGVLADTLLARGGRVIGVIPDFMIEKEWAHTHLTELRVVKSMHERKAIMAELADGFVALPGGFGTLEEFCEVLTWAQLGLHRKPFGLVNTDGFYAHFLSFLDHAVQEQLIKPKNRRLVLQAATPAELLDQMACWSSPSTASRIAPSQT